MLKFKVGDKVTYTDVNNIYGSLKHPQKDQVYTILTTNSKAAIHPYSIDFLTHAGGNWACQEHEMTLVQQGGTFESNRLLILGLEALKREIDKQIEELKNGK